MLNFEKFRQGALNKPTFAKKEVIKFINDLENDYKNEMVNDNRFVNIGKVYRPKEIAKYDIISHMVCGTPHPCMIYKVDNAYVYGVAFSSTKAAHNLYEFTKSRMFSGNYMTNTLTRQTKGEALNHFVGIFDDKAEAETAFAELKRFYKELFKF